MLLETGGNVRFQVRPLENILFHGESPKPEKLILDGQQRLTTLTQVLAIERPAKTFDDRGKPISRYYYVDINATLDNEIDEGCEPVDQPAGRRMDLALATSEIARRHRKGG
jgi:hypothetical protein